MLRFGPFEVDFAKSELRKSGARIRLQEQPLTILKALLERPGEIVTRDQLRDLLWPDGTFVDFERSLNAAVGKLRQSLNDSADHPLYIETVARKGYRFVAPVTEAEPRRVLSDQVVADPPPAPVVVTSAEQAPAKSSPAAHAWWRWAMAGTLAAVLLLALTLSPRPQAERGKPMLWLDLDIGGDVSQPTVSPDGMTIVFVASGRLAVRKLDQSTITPLAGTEGASSPFFSPDGLWIGYFAAHQLRKVSIAGSESVTLCEAALDGGATWTEDGQIIAAVNTTGELSSISASGGPPRPFVQLEGEAPDTTSHRRPVALPAGKGLLFISGTGIAVGTLKVLPRGAREPRTLVENASTARYLSTGYLLFNRGSTVFTAPMDLDRLQLTGPESPVIEGVAHDHFYGSDFDVSASGTLVFRRAAPTANRVLTWLDASGAGVPVMARSGAYSSPRVSSDGTRVAFVADSELWVWDLIRKNLRQVTFGAAVACCPAWTSDGDYVAFATKSSVRWARSDGSGTVEEMPNGSGSFAVPWSFSSDGKWLTFHRNEPETSYDLWATAVDRTGGLLRLGPPQLLLKQPGVQAAPAISPDGRWVAYGSVETGRQPDIYVMPFSPGDRSRSGKWAVSTEGGRSPRWSPSGREIFFRSPDDYLMVAAVTGKGDSFQAERPKVWSAQRLSNVGVVPNFDVAPDGKRVIGLLDTADTRPNDTHLRVLLNTDQELRRRTK